MGNKKTSDFISANTKIDRNGNVTGTLHYVTDVASFGTGEDAKGYFFPVKLNNNGKEVTCTNKDGKIVKSTDSDWLLKVAQDKKTTFKFEAEGMRTLTLKFDKVKLDNSTGYDAVMIPGQGTNMDAVKTAAELISDDVKISWDGTKGNVTGTVHWHDFTGTDHFKNAPMGHFVPVVVTGYDGKKIKATGSNNNTAELEDPKWIIRVNDFITNDKQAKLEAENKTLAELTFKDMTLEVPVGEDAFNPTKTDYGEFGKTTDYYEDGKLGVTWEGTTAKITGTLKWIPEVSHPAKIWTPGNFFAFSLVDWFKGKEITTKCVNEKKAEDIDWVYLITNKKKPVTVKYGDILIATFDLSRVKLETPIGRDAISLADKDFVFSNGKKTSDYVKEDARFKWVHTLGAMAGTLLSDSKGVYHVPLKISDMYDNIQISGAVKAEQDPNFKNMWLVTIGSDKEKITNAAKVITIKDGKNKIGEFTFAKIAFDDKASKDTP